MQSMSPFLAGIGSHVAACVAGGMPDRKHEAREVDFDLQYSDFCFPSFSFFVPSFLFFFLFLSANFVSQCLQLDQCIISAVFKCPSEK